MGASSTQPAPVPVSPQPILEAAWSFGLTRVLATAVELDVFTRIEGGSSAVEDLAREAGCSPRAMRMLLDTLSALRYVNKEDGRYALAPLSAVYLSKNSPRYLGAYVLHITSLCWSPWSQLTEIVHSGKPARQVESEEEAGEFFSQFVDSLHALSADAAAVAAQALRAARPQVPLKVLDVGAGSAVWSLAVAKQNPQAHLTIVDWPAVIERITKRFVAREDVASRCTYLPGNFREVDFGESRFDVVILGHICHSEGLERSQHLIQRAHRALKSGGQILIAELIPDDARREASLPLLFAINMLVLTEEGDVFTLGEYRQWLEAAGFTDVCTIQAPAPSPLILANKP